MSIAELTNKIESLSAEDYNMVIMLVNRLSEKSEISGLAKLSEDELVEELSESIKKSNMGATKSAKAVSGSMSKRLKEMGLHRIGFVKHRLVKGVYSL